MFDGPVAVTVAKEGVDFMIGLGMVTIPFERVGRAMEIIEPAPHRGALLDGESGLCRLKVDQRETMSIGSPRSASSTIIAVESTPAPRRR